MRRVLLLSALLLLAAGTVVARQPWRVVPNCRLLPNESNDGDSFHVMAAGRHYIFRLYFVDAPETDESFPERVGEQASYFGITPAQAVEAGKLAKQFTNEKLAHPFTVRTCLQDALGRSKQERFYAFIGTDDGDLGELLVANGLARLHGTQAEPVDLSSPQVEWQKLQRLEREAKAQKVGGWGAMSGRMSARMAQPLATTGADSFDAWFHPERVATRGRTVPGPTPTPFGPQGAWPFPAATATPTTAPVANAIGAKSSGASKLDPNRATANELLAIPGVGPVMAKRIMEARPFKSADELRKVKGIGVKRFEQIRPYFD